MARIPKRMPPKHFEPLPTEPGVYYWDEWEKLVEVHRVPGSRTKLFVVPPTVSAIPVVISEFIAGDFVKIN